MSKLFTPITIGRVVFKNRIVMAAMDTHTALRDGSATAKMLKFLELRAQGGAGAVMTGAAFIDTEASRFSVGQLGAYDDELIGSLHTIAEAIHVHNSRAILQICHAGRQKFFMDKSMISASPVAWRPSGQTPKEATTDEIKTIVARFAAAARRAQEAEFDGVEIHGAHGYLVTNFLSPYTNRRQDEYGGGLHNRMRLALEIVAAAREAVGPDFPIIFRLSAAEHIEQGLTLEESVEICKTLERHGVDAVHISGGIHETLDWEVPPMYRPGGLNVPAAETIKKYLDIPVLVAGGINHPDLMESIVEEGKADLVALARPLLADPLLPRKLKEGRQDSVRPCIRCNEACLSRGAKEIRCAVNAEGNRETDYPLVSTRSPKQVLIAGGGPAGLEAARVAALRGHEVVLYEQEDALGGTLIAAARPAFKKDLQVFLDYLISEVRDSSVRVITGRKVTATLCRDANPDVVIVATGARPKVPAIPGVDQGQVMTPNQALTSAEGFFRQGARAVVVGAGLVGCEVAWFLTDLGCRVTLTSRRSAEELAEDAEKSARMLLRRFLPGYLDNLLGHLWLQEIEPGCALFAGPGGERVDLEGDYFIIAAGYEPRNDLLTELEGSVKAEVFAIGDCVDPRRIFNAVHEANDIARHI